MTNWKQKIEVQIATLDEEHPNACPDLREVYIAAEWMRRLLDVAVAAEGIEREMCRDNPYFPHHQAVVDALDKLRGLSEDDTWAPEERDEEIDDLVNRLRKGHGIDSRGNRFPTKLDKEAADEIERLQEELRLHDKAAELSTAEIERLLEALERIAKGCDLSNEAQAIAREALRDE